MATGGCGGNYISTKKQETGNRNREQEKHLSSQVIALFLPSYIAINKSSMQNETK